jgi:acyl-coenzyme A thioesterase 13
MANQYLELFQSLIDQPLPETIPAFTKWLNGRLKKAENGSFQMEFIVREEMTNGLGLLHGGVQSAMLDEIIGMMVTALDKEAPAVSVNLSVDFISKAKAGDTIVAKSEVIRQGRQIIQIKGELSHTNGTLISIATSNMLVLQKKL